MNTLTTQPIDNSWAAFFATHAEFSKLKPKWWTGGSGNVSLLRYYFDLPSGKCFIQRKMVTSGDLSCGDGWVGNLDTVEDVFSWGGDAAAIAEVRTKAGEEDAMAAGCDADGEIWQRIVALDNRPKRRKK